MSGPPRRILLHPGFHKTGTSSIQQFLWLNRDRLAPAVQVYLLRHLRPAAMLAMSFSKTGNLIYIADLVEVLDTIFRETPPLADTLVLSCEGLSGHLPGWPGVAGYDAAPATIGAVTLYLQDRFPEAALEILLTTRDRAGWLDSAWRHHLAGQRLTDSFPEFAARLVGTDLDRTAAHIAEAVDPVPVHRLPLATGAAHPLGPGGAFVAHLGLPAEALRNLTQAGHSNPGPDAPLAAELLALNRSNLGEGALREEKARRLAAAGPRGWVAPA